MARSSAVCRCYQQAPHRTTAVVYDAGVLVAAARNVRSFAAPPRGMIGSVM